LAIRCIGDREYGGAFRTKANRMPDAVRHIVDAFPRQALHAWLLAFEHPATGEVMRFEAPLPDDMVELRDALTVPFEFHSTFREKK
jgi:23S rRNA pseudouridine1911/1915/1917 synthase